MTVNFLAPWVEDNQAFIRQLDAFGARLLAEAPKVRQRELDAGRIRLATPAERRLSLDAVDSADLIASVNYLALKGTRLAREARPTASKARATGRLALAKIL
jgi:hypothetical protein